MDKKWTRVATPQDGRVTQQWLGAVHVRAHVAYVAYGAAGACAGSFGAATETGKIRLRPTTL